MTDELNFDHPFFEIPLKELHETTAFQMAYKSKKSTLLK